MAGSHAHWLGVSAEQDAADTAAVLQSKGCDWLVVDHYALDAQWEAHVRGCSGHVLVIDDLADRAHDCDLLLDQTYSRRSEDYLSLVRPVPGCCAVVPTRCCVRILPRSVTPH
ncbi:hypothetical protein UMZ34_02635 [Halopseudomonas pachastrellae]|nr:hypothetical protein UMZ34_02635 [Halopseudomonas pachastrellae]